MLLISVRYSIEMAGLSMVSNWKTRVRMKSRNLGKTTSLHSLLIRVNSRIIIIFLVITKVRSTTRTLTKVKSTTRTLTKVRSTTRTVTRVGITTSLTTQNKNDI